MDPKHNESPSHLPTLISSLPGPYQPAHVLTYNTSTSVRIAQLHGGFIWHAHPDTDELFYVVSGGPLHLEIANKETNREGDGYGVVEMGPGDLYMVEKGRRHRPNADAMTQVLFFNRTGTVNTGDAAGTEEGKGRTVTVKEDAK